MTAEPYDENVPSTLPSGIRCAKKTGLKHDFHLKNWTVGSIPTKTKCFKIHPTPDNVKLLCITDGMSTHFST